MSDSVYQVYVATLNRVLSSETCEDIKTNFTRLLSIIERDMDSKLKRSLLEDLDILLFYWYHDENNKSILSLVEEYYRLLLVKELEDFSELEDDEIPDLDDIDIVV